MKMVQKPDYFPIHHSNGGVISSFHSFDMLFKYFFITIGIIKGQLFNMTLLDQDLCILYFRQILPDPNICVLVPLIRNVQ